MERKLKTNQKGITLIALVITIIVMLILVIVTINVATNGGLFDSARKAANNTTSEAEKETLLSSLIPCYNVKTGEYDLTKLNDNLPKGWSYDVATKTVTTDKKNKISVDKNGIVEETNLTDSIVGTYNFEYILHDASGIEETSELKVNSDGTIVLTETVLGENAIISNGTYTYSADTKQAEITINYLAQGGDPAHDETYLFYYKVLKNGNEIINKIFYLSGSGTTIFTTNGSVGMIPLTGFTYTNNNGDSITFSEITINGKIYGIYTDKNEEKEQYVCLDGKIFFDDDDGIDILEDYSTFTFESSSGNTVYTKN